MTMNSNKLAGRRAVLALASTGLLAATVPWASPAQAGDTRGAVAPIAQLDGALIAAMKASSRGAPVSTRYAALQPVIEQVFDLESVLAASVGFSWLTLPSRQKAALMTAFRRYTVATYVANFNGYDGQRFEIAPGVREVGNGEVVVRTRLNRRNRSPVKLAYVMRQGPAGWQAVDVLTDGSISRVAVQRSDFQELLASGGAPALAAALKRKAATLSIGAA
ncbi:MAG: ABC transporter substrate-binding protein [Acetobacteraceae bacterium]